MHDYFNVELSSKKLWKIFWQNISWANKNKKQKIPFWVHQSRLKLHRRMQKLKFYDLIGLSVPPRVWFAVYWCSLNFPPFSDCLHFHFYSQLRSFYDKTLNFEAMDKAASNKSSNFEPFSFGYCNACAVKVFNGIFM